MKNKDLISSALGHREPLLNLNTGITENRVLSHVVTTTIHQPMMTHAESPTDVIGIDPGVIDSAGDPSVDALCDTIDPGDPFDNPGDPTDPGLDPSDPLSDPGSDTLGDPGGGGGIDYFGW